MGDWEYEIYSLLTRLVGYLPETDRTVHAYPVDLPQSASGDTDGLLGHSHHLSAAWIMGQSLMRGYSIHQKH
jgi:hypothetical protein